MSTNTKFKAMLEALINEDQETAKQLFHKIVVDNSREIYDRLIAEEMSQYDDEDEWSDEEQYEAAEGDEDADFGADDEFNMDDAEGEDDFGGEMDDELDTEFADGEGEEGDIEDRVLDLEDALEDLKAEFEKLMGDEEGESEHDDMDFGPEEGEEDDFGGEDEFAAPTTDDDDISKMMEYVNKVALPKHGDDGVQNKSVVAKKNDMGGTSANIVRGGSETSKGGTQGGLLKPTTEKLDAGNVNVPGAKSATKLSAVSKGHGAEKRGQRETAQNKRSIVGGK